MAQGGVGFQALRRVIDHGGGSVLAVAKRASDLPSGLEIVTTNPDEDCSPAAFRFMLDELLSGPEPELVSIGAAEALQELRVDAGA